jgi:3-hydroxyisobutyrate dehydrogenase-like beta-hydroxyacid dehydrogenase
MSLALEAGRSVSVPLPIGQNCADVYDKVVKGGMARKDFSVVFKYLRQLRDQELKK